MTGGAVGLIGNTHITAEENDQLWAMKTANPVAGHVTI